jgi:hypothetical protein
MIIRIVVRALIYTANQLTRPLQAKSIDYEGIGKLLPGILVGNGAVLECLTRKENLLIVLLAVLPELLIVYTVATSTLQLLHC